MNARLLVLSLAACLASAAHAGYKVTEIVGRHELRNATGVLIGAYPTHEECVANLKLLPPAAGPEKVRAGTCKAVTHLDWQWNCDDAVKPPLTTFKVLDPNGVVYSGPYCAEGETCTTPEGWHSSANAQATPEGTLYTFTDVGGLRLNEDGTTDEFVQVLKPWPKCWAWDWQRVELPAPIPPDNPATGFVPPLDPGALDGEKEP